MPWCFSLFFAVAVTATAAAAFLLAHHHRRTLFEFVDLDGHPANDIFVDRSLTLDLGNGFARHFGRPLAEGEDHADAVEADDGGRVVPAPIIEVSGRTYPVEIRYRPLTDEPSPDDPEDDADGTGTAP